MKKILISILTIGCVLLLTCGCNLTSSATPSKTKAAATPSASASTEKIYSVGDIAKNEYFEEKILNVQHYDDGKNGALKPGDEYVIVEVNIKNNTGLEYTLMPTVSFKMQNSHGIIQNAQHTDMDINVTIANSGDVTGHVTFEEPKEDDGLIFIFQAGDTIKFNIK